MGRAVARCASIGAVTSLTFAAVSSSVELKAPVFDLFLYGVGLGLVAIPVGIITEVTLVQAALNRHKRTSLAVVPALSPEMQGVTLVGTPSGGGSGRTEGYGLAASGLRIRLSSMASFRPDGKLYDGNGIQPDIVVKPARGDWIGKGDAQLDKALELLK